MKAFVVLTRKFTAGRFITERHIVAAVSADAASTIATNRFGGTVLNVLLS